MFKKIVLGLLLMGLMPVFSGSGISVGTVSVAEAQQKGAVWIDVRTQSEWDKGHLKRAVLIPYDQISKKIGRIVKDKYQAINLYCRSGRRAEIALRTLEQMGYKNVQNLGRYSLLNQAQ
ncbi:MAG: rhodanese-like domain-containing protein [Gammaproteobacteria bacterium]|nr:MAG: rhodanese-like domain-containing protein [Gammaproteobacteria bacterium]